MSLKSIDMQLSVTKSMELSQLQNQIAQNPVSDQAALALASQKKTEEERQKSSKVEQTDEASIHDEEHGGSNNGYSQTKKKKGINAAEDPDAVKHPYKGKHIDFSL